jgi:hypothetical protein
MKKKKCFYKSNLRNFYPAPVLHVRAFSISQIRFSPNTSRLPTTSIAPISQLTNEERTFISNLFHRDIQAIQQLNHTIEDNNNSIQDIYNRRDLSTNLDGAIRHLTDLIEEDITERQTYTQSAELLTAIYHGDEPPIHNMEAWLGLRNDLDNSEDVGIDNLRNYVLEVANTNITGDQFIEMVMANRDNLSETRSRDNSQYSEDIDESNSRSESESESDSDSDLYQSVDTHLDESSSSSDSNPDLYQSADTHLDESSSSSDSDANDDPSSTSQGLNPNNNESNDNSKFNSTSQSTDNQESTQNNNNSFCSNTDVNLCADDNESNTSSNKKSMTDDALDISDTLHMFYDESSVKSQSTIDFVLEKQQEEMPDIMDSDGGE